MSDQVIERPRDTEHLLKILMNKEEITWKTMLTVLVRDENMDTWDLDCSILSKKFIELLKKMQEMDLYISGKVVLAAALLLKIKSTRLIGEDLSRFDQMFVNSEESEYVDEFFEFGDDFGQHYVEKNKMPKFGLIPRTPQPRKRKVSIYDLMDALQKAMEVKKRRLQRSLPEEFIHRVPGKQVDITQIIREVFLRIQKVFDEDGEAFLAFTDLCPNEAPKEEKVYTFVPLLHLTNQRKIDLEQDKSFGPIGITMAKKE